MWISFTWRRKKRLGYCIQGWECNLQCWKCRTYRISSWQTTIEWEAESVFHVNWMKITLFRISKYSIIGIYNLEFQKYCLGLADMTWFFPIPRQIFFKCMFQFQGDELELNASHTIDSLAAHCPHLNHSAMAYNNNTQTLLA